MMTFQVPLEGYLSLQEGKYLIWYTYHCLMLVSIVLFATSHVCVTCYLLVLSFCLNISSSSASWRVSIASIWTCIWLGKWEINDFWSKDPRTSPDTILQVCISLDQTMLRVLQLVNPFWFQLVFNFLCFHSANWRYLWRFCLYHFKLD